MEIRHQPVDSFEAIAGGDENRGIAFKGANDVIVGRCAFQQTQRSCTHCNHAAAACPHGVQPIGRCRINPAPFGVHLMIFGVIRLHGQESACADMKGQRFMLHATSSQRRHQFRRKM